MPDGALVIVIEGTRGGRDPAAKPGLPASRKLGDNRSPALR